MATASIYNNPQKIMSCFLIYSEGLLINKICPCEQEYQAIVALVTQKNDLVPSPVPSPVLYTVLPTPSPVIPTPSPTPSLTASPTPSPVLRTMLSMPSSLSVPSVPSVPSSVPSSKPVSVSSVTSEDNSIVPAVVAISLILLLVGVIIVWFQRTKRSTIYTEESNDMEEGVDENGMATEE